MGLLEENHLLQTVFSLEQAGEGTEMQKTNQNDQLKKVCGSLQRVRKFSAAVNQKIEKRFDDNKPQASPDG
jgi:hypothetical protein